MVEKQAGTGSLTEAFSFSLFGALAHLDAATLIGAFAGAIIFVLSASDFHALKRVILGCVALVSGYISAPEAADIIKAILPTGTAIHNGVGATFSAAVIVRVLLTISGKDGLSFLTRKLEKK